MVLLITLGTCHGVRDMYWSVTCTSHCDECRCKADSPTSDSLTGALILQALLRTIGDSWDALRAVTMQALYAMPCPLAGFEQPQQLIKLLGLARQLLIRTQVYEADAGAQLLAYIAHSYAGQLGWRITIYPAVVALEPLIDWSPISPEHTGTVQSEPLAKARSNNLATSRLLSARLNFLDSCLTSLAGAVSAAEQDMAAACHSCFAHGQLLLLRYVLPAIPWAELAKQPDLVRPVDKHACVGPCILTSFATTCFGSGRSKAAC
jgi:hypothetical protein